MKLHVIAIGLAIGLIVSTFAQQKEPSRAQIVAEPGGTTGGSSALKPIDKAALRAAVDATAEKLLVPGAVVILSTPQSEFTVSYGTTTLGTTGPPRADTHFRIASNTKTMTAAVIGTTGPGRSARSRRSGLEIRFARARRRPDHHRRPFKGKPGTAGRKDLQSASGPSRSRPAVAGRSWGHRRICSQSCFKRRRGNAECRFRRAEPSV